MSKKHTFVIQSVFIWKSVYNLQLDKHFDLYISLPFVKNKLYFTLIYHL